MSAVEPSGASPETGAPAARPRLSPARLAALAWLALLGAVVCVLCAVWLTAIPFSLGGVLFAGGLVGLGRVTRREAAATGAAAGLLGGALTIWAADSTLIAERLANLPVYARADTPSSWFNAFVLPVTAHNVVNIYFAEPLGRAAFPAFAAALTALVAVAVAAAAGAGPASDTASGQRRRRIALAALTLLLCAAFAGTAWSESTTFRTRSGHEPADGTYNFDPYIYMRTFYVMTHGPDYYHALVRAASGDSRLIRERAVRDGRFVGWVTAPGFIRLPTAFLLWRYVPGGAIGVLALSIGLCTLLLGAMTAVFEPYLGARALLVPLLTFPLLLGATVWVNIYLPDWWAALALLGSLLAVMRGRFLTAGVLALAAALFRETATLWLLVLFVLASWYRLRGREAWGRRVALYAVMLAAFAVAYVLHLRAGAGVIAAVHVRRSVLAVLTGSAARPLVERLVQPAAYLMLPYGYYAVPVVTFLVLQFAGYFGALRERPQRRALVLGFALAWAMTTATLGGTSSYWGQLYMPGALMGTAALLARPDLFVAALRRSTAEAPAPAVVEGA